MFVVPAANNVFLIELVLHAKLVSATVRISHSMRENQRNISRLVNSCNRSHLVETVLELLSPALLHLGATLVFRHLGPLLADHLLQVVDLVLELVLLVPEE